MIKIIECPRDAMQGLHGFVPTNLKAAYINSLLQVGFDTLDFGSFVSPGAIPQMADTVAVLDQLRLESTATKLLAIVANIRGAEDALHHLEIDYLGFPFSISETFQIRNTNQTIDQALQTIETIQNLCVKNNRQLVGYLSMGFGNPYEDPYSPELVSEYADKLIGLGLTTISLADTVGVADDLLIHDLFKVLGSDHPEIEFGAHFHARPEEARTHIRTAYMAGCRRFDGALRGFGGCPMAKDDLVGNVATETIIEYLRQEESLDLNEEALNKASDLSIEIFG